MFANLFGDFVKGSDLSHYPSIIQDGITLHRNIDQYIDNHPKVKELLHQLYEDLPKISGVAIDLYFDHLLARNWEQYHHEDLHQFIHSFYSSKPLDEKAYSDEFIFMIARMKEYNWLEQYQFHYGLTKACQGINRRLSFENAILKAPDVFIEKEKEITETFHEFMKDATIHFKSYFKNI